MKTVLVSVISQQTIPNLLLIKEFKDSTDDHIFITTNMMESPDNPAGSKSRSIERAAFLEEGSTQRIIVREDEWQDITLKLKTIQLDNNARYIVNLTGGTKVMTLAIYEFFAQPGNSIYYIPFPKNEYHEVYPSKSNPVHKLKSRCNLYEYLAANGLHYQQTSNPVASPEETALFFERVKSYDFDLNKIPEIQFAHDMLAPERKSYFSGGWFEEYVYNLLRDKLKLNNKNIVLNAELLRSPYDKLTGNEFDVIFISDNTLHVIECKASMGQNPYSIKNNMDRFTHKLSAITKDFGLKVNTYILTLTNLRKGNIDYQESLENRRKILGIKAIADKKNFTELTEIINLFK